MHFTSSLLVLGAGLLATVHAQAIGTNCNVVSNHVIKAGETLTSIGRDTKTSIAQILFVNPKITNPNFIAADDTIAIPNPACVVAVLEEETLPTAVCVVGNSTAVGASGKYTVISGDTMFIIATDKLKITLASFIAANPQVTNPDQIQIDQVLNVPICAGKKQGRTPSSRGLVPVRFVV